MAEHSRIEWTDATWNPVTGCTLVSEGCRNCYAAGLAAGRMRHHPSRQGLARRNADGVAAFTGEVRLNEEWLTLPLRWTRPRRIFVCAHGDLFHEDVPDEWIDRVFAVMQRAGRRHTFQVLTKRPERARDYLAALYPLGEADAQEWFDRGFVSPVAKPLLVPFRNVWLGVSAEDQATADARIPPLLDARVAVRFLSAEPLLGPIDPTYLTIVAKKPGSDRAGIHVNALTGKHCESGVPYGGPLDWVIVGGESGRRARPMHPDWARSLRDQCQAAGVPFFFKQWGEWGPDEGPQLNGRDPIFEGRARCAWWDGNSWHHEASGFEVDLDASRGHGEWVYRLNRKRSGRLLDGCEHSETPA